jgi:diamine N-acetyltransferase
VAVEFRLARPDDLDAVHDLRRAFYHEDGSPWVEAPARLALSALLADPSAGQVWVAVDGGVIVGYVVLVFGYSLEFHGRDAFVDELYLRSSHRRQGLGTAALRIVESACRESAVRALHLEVDTTNEAARALYRAWGFTEHGRQLMTKWLPPERTGSSTTRCEA